MSIHRHSKTGVLLHSKRAVLLCASLLAVAACAGKHGVVTAGSPRAMPRKSTSATETSQAAPGSPTSSGARGTSSPTATLPALAPEPGAASPPGEVVVAKSGRGPAIVHVVALVSGKKITVRYACTGPGPTSLQNAAGAPVLGIRGCAGDRAVYGTSYTSSPADREIRVVVGTGVNWKVGVWIQ